MTISIHQEKITNRSGHKIKPYSGLLSSLTILVVVWASLASVAAARTCCHSCAYQRIKADNAPSPTGVRYFHSARILPANYGGIPATSTSTSTIIATATPTTTPTPTCTPTPIPITPITECVDIQSDGTILAHFGYHNSSSAEVQLAISALNHVAIGDALVNQSSEAASIPGDAGQPTSFFTGRVANSFTAIFPSDQTMHWVLGNISVTASITSQRCQGATIECVDIDNRALQATLDGYAASQRRLARRLANRILTLNPNSQLKKQASSYLAQAEDLYLAQWSSIWGSFSSISRNCSSCAAVDKNVDIQTLSTHSQKFVRLSQLSAQSLKLANGGKLSRSSQALVTSVAKLHSKFTSNSKKLPRFESACD